MKTRPIVGVELKHVKRYSPMPWHAKTSTKYRTDPMEPVRHGGYVPYTDYCLNVSKLKDKIYELETRLINLKRFGKSRMLRQR